MGGQIERSMDDVVDEDFFSELNELSNKKFEELPGLVQSFSTLDRFASIIFPEDPSGNPTDCLPLQTGHNAHARVSAGLYWNLHLHWGRLTELAASGRLYDLNRLNEVILEIQYFPDPGYYYCAPSGVEILDWAIAMNQRHNDLANGWIANMDSTFNDVQRNFQECQSLFSRLVRLRAQYDSENPPKKETIEAIRILYPQFQMSLARLKRWSLANVRYRGGNSWNFEPLKLPIATMEKQAPGLAIPDEDSSLETYAQLGMEVPSSGALSAGKRSKFFSNGELVRHSTWVEEILADEFLDALDSIYLAYLEAERRILQITGSFIDPVTYNESDTDFGPVQRCYGVGVEFKVTSPAFFEMDPLKVTAEDLVPKAEDWESLRRVVSQFSPDYVAPMAQTTQRKLYADWRRFAPVPSTSAIRSLTSDEVSSNAK